MFYVQFTSTSAVLVIFQQAKFNEKMSQLKTNNNNIAHTAGLLFNNINKRYTVFENKFMKK